MKHISITLSACLLLAFASCNNASTPKEQGAEIDESTTKVAVKDPNDCTVWVENSIDKMTGKSSANSASYIMLSNDKTSPVKAAIFKSNPTEKAEGGVTLVFITDGCIDDKAKINVLFADNSRLEFLSDGDFNCEGEAAVYFGGIFGKMDVLEQLKTKKLQTIRIATRQGYTQAEVGKEGADAFYYTLTCILQAK